MSGKTITKLFVFIGIAIAIAYDVYIIMTHGKSASISWFFIQDLKKDYPLINDALWFTMGHLFWRMKTPKEERDDLIKEWQEEKKKEEKTWNNTTKEYE